MSVSSLWCRRCSTSSRRLSFDWRTRASYSHWTIPWDLHLVQGCRPSHYVTFESTVGHMPKGQAVLTFARFLRHSVHAFAVTSPAPLLRLDLPLAGSAAAVAASEFVAVGAGGDMGRGARRLSEALAVECDAGGSGLDLPSAGSSCIGSMLEVESLATQATEALAAILLLDRHNEQRRWYKSNKV